jgi:hypothetical protein
LIPTLHRGHLIVPPPVVGTLPPLTNKAGPFHFQDQATVGVGLQLGLGERSILSVGAVTPILAHRAYTGGATMGFNYFF